MRTGVSTIRIVSGQYCTGYGAILIMDTPVLIVDKPPYTGVTTTADLLCPYYQRWDSNPPQSLTGSNPVATGITGDL